MASAVKSVVNFLVTSPIQFPSTLFSARRNLLPCVFLLFGVVFVSHAQTAPPPVATINIGNDNREGRDRNVRALITLTPKPTVATTVNFEISGDGVRFFAETEHSVEFTLASSETDTRQGDVEIIDDLMPGDDETVTFCIVAGEGYTIAASDAGGCESAPIQDNDAAPGRVTEVVVTATVNPGELRVSWVNPTTDSRRRTYPDDDPDPYINSIINGYRICVAATKTAAKGGVDCVATADVDGLSGQAQNPTEATVGGVSAEGLWVSVAVRNGLETDDLAKRTGQFSDAVTVSDETDDGDDTDDDDDTEPPPAVLSDAVTLSELTLSDGELSPVFAAQTTTYTAIVSNDTEMVTVTATPTSDTANPDITATAATGTVAVVAGATIDLAIGDTEIMITVTADDGSMAEYTITITRAPLPVASLAIGRDYIEGGAAIRVTVTLTPKPLLPTTVNFAFSGSAVGPFVAESDGSVDYLITSRETANRNTEFTIVDDLLPEARAELTVCVAAGDGYTIADSNADACDSAPVRDNDFPPGPPEMVSAAATDNDDEIRVAWVNPMADGEGRNYPDDPQPYVNSIINGYRVCVAATDADVTGDTNCLATADVDDLTGAAQNPTTATVSGLSAVLAATLWVSVAVRNGITATTPERTGDFSMPMAVMQQSVAATLQSLSLSDGDLAPPFAAETMDYTAEVGYEVTMVTVTADAGDAAGVVVTAPTATVDGNVVSDLAFGMNVITVTVTPEATTVPTAAAVYMITVTRAALPMLTIAATLEAVSEGSDANVSFTLTSDTEAPSDGLTATITLTGGEDYVADDQREQTVTIASGMKQAEVNFPITDDLTASAPAMVTATIGDSDKYDIAGMRRLPQPQRQSEPQRSEPQRSEPSEPQRQQQSQRQSEPVSSQSQRQPEPVQSQPQPSPVPVPELQPPPESSP